MLNKSISVIGIMIGGASNNAAFRLYQIEKVYNGSVPTCSTRSVDGWKNIIKDVVRGHKTYNDDGEVNLDAATSRFVIVYDASTYTKENKTLYGGKEYIEAVLDLININKRNDLLPVLVSIGRPHLPVNNSIREKCSIIKEVENIASCDDEFESIIKNEFKEIEFLCHLQKAKKELSEQLAIILAKAVTLRRDGHLIAADKADECLEALGKHSEVYFSDPTKEAYDVFKKQAKEDISSAYDELSKHRGLNHILANIGFAILGFGVLYLVAVLINRTFFFNKTDSAEKLNTFQEHVENNAFQVDFTA